MPVVSPVDEVWVWINSLLGFSVDCMHGVSSLTSPSLCLCVCVLEREGERMINQFVLVEYLVS